MGVESRMFEGRATESFWGIAIALNRAPKGMKIRDVSQNTGGEVVGTVESWRESPLLIVTSDFLGRRSHQF